ncbi:MAG: hypothetical protein IPP07_29870 [Holophagales bacterium]|nr:hypothetical protein [Holophagales bacterium]
MDVQGRDRDSEPEHGVEDREQPQNNDDGTEGHRHGKEVSTDGQQDAEGNCALAANAEVPNGERYKEEFKSDREDQ